MDSYQALAKYYDAFTDDVPYEAWLQFFEKIFYKEGLQPKTVLDLACGTGSMLRVLDQKGYDTIGVDGSVEMLMMAREKTYRTMPLFLHQTMENLDLFGTVDACLCCLDSVNYITSYETLKRVFRKVELFLEPGGIFIFDVNTEGKFRRIDGECYVRETEEVFCVWQTELQDRLCFYDFDLFIKEEKHWRRQCETHRERMYSIEELNKALEDAGFIGIQIYPELSMEPKDLDQEDRIFFTARKRL